MLEVLISAVIAGLAIAGGAALGLRLFRSTGRVILNAAELAAADGVAEAGARRGDVTRMQEGRLIQKAARAARARALRSALFWLVWLVLPLAFGYLSIAYAFAAPLWLLPDRPLRTGRTSIR